MSAEHVHRCLSCTPGMVPDFDRDDPRYHDGEKCGHGMHDFNTVRLNGEPLPGYTNGMFEGPEGWVLRDGDRIAPTSLNDAPVDAIHLCTCRDQLADICLTPVFGHVEAPHPPGVP